MLDPKKCSHSQWGFWRDAPDSPCNLYRECRRCGHKETKVEHRLKAYEPVEDSRCESIATCRCGEKTQRLEDHRLGVVIRKVSKYFSNDRPKDECWSGWEEARCEHCSKVFTRYEGENWNCGGSDGTRTTIIETLRWGHGSPMSGSFQTYSLPHLLHLAEESRHRKLAATLNGIREAVRGLTSLVGFLALLVGAYHFRFELLSIIKRITQYMTMS